MRNFWSVLATVVICITILCVSCGVLTVLTTRPTVTTTVAANTPASANPTQEIAATPYLTPTPLPVINPIPTEAIVPTATPASVSCDTPSIKAGLNTADTEFGEYLDTTLGKRMTFTSRKVVVPAKAWNDPLSPAELKSVETTWLPMQVCIPQGTFARIFAGGLEQGTSHYDSGVLMNIKPGVYHFNLRNGEVVIWYPDQDKAANDDLIRIFDQIKVGNFDIHAPLEFFAASADIVVAVPAGLVKTDNFQIVPALVAK